jgi:uncharacterized protein YndB with AHSA1/START domain
VNGSLHTNDGRPMLRFERRLPHARERVWRAITEPAELAHWFPAEVEVDLRPGGTIKFVFPHDGGTTAGEVTELDPPRLFEYSWEGAILRFELRAEGEACVLVFTHTFDGRDEAPKFAAGWHLCLDRLEAVLGGDTVPESMDPWDELYPRYVESLGVGPTAADLQELRDGTVERAEDGRQVLRFVRHLRWPVERVWGSLTRPEELVKWLAEADIDLTMGGHVELRWLNTDAEGNQSVARGTITGLEPPRLIEIDTDVHGLLRWELDRAAHDSCLLTLTNTVTLSEEQLTENLAGWHIHLDHLVAALSGDPVNWPTWSRDHRDRWAGYRDRYVAALS